MGPPLWWICKRLNFVQKVEVCGDLWGPPDQQPVHWGRVCHAAAAGFWSLAVKVLNRFHFPQTWWIRTSSVVCWGKASVEPDGCCSTVGLSAWFSHLCLAPAQHVATSAQSWSDTQSCGCDKQMKIIKRADEMSACIEDFNVSRDEQSMLVRKCSKADKPSRIFFAVYPSRREDRRL